METHIQVGQEFARQFKRLSKKYRSLKEDLRKWREEIVQNPLVGDDLGGGVRKIRIAISSKGKGKSGGARILTLNVLVKADEMKVTLLTIYDKNEISSVPDAYIEYLLQHV